MQTCGRVPGHAIENDIYGGLRYIGESLPTLKQLGGTVLVRSFSKVAFPGLRVGWIIAPKPLIADLTEARQWCDLHTDQLSQAVLLRFAESGRLAEHMERTRTPGASVCEAALVACEQASAAGTALHPARRRHEHLGAVARTAGCRRAAAAGRSAKE